MSPFLSQLNLEQQKCAFLLQYCLLKYDNFNWGLRDTFDFLIVLDTCCFHLQNFICNEWCKIICICTILSGIRLTIDMISDKGERITDLKVRSKLIQTHDSFNEIYEPIVDNKDYEILTTSFLAVNGGDGYKETLTERIKNRIKGMM